MKTSNQKKYFVRKYRLELLERKEDELDKIKREAINEYSKYSFLIEEWIKKIIFICDTLTNNDTDIDIFELKKLINRVQRSIRTISVCTYYHDTWINNKLKSKMLYAAIWLYRRDNKKKILKIINEKCKDIQIDKVYKQAKFKIKLNQMEEDF